jgi:hypothetical protein
VFQTGELLLVGILRTSAAAAVPLDYALLFALLALFAPSR